MANASPMLNSSQVSPVKHIYLFNGTTLIPEFWAGFHKCSILTHFFPLTFIFYHQLLLISKISIAFALFYPEPPPPCLLVLHQNNAHFVNFFYCNIYMQIYLANQFSISTARRSKSSLHFSLLPHKDLKIHERLLRMWSHLCTHPWLCPQILKVRYPPTLNPCLTALLLGNLPSVPIQIFLKDFSG